MNQSRARNACSISSPRFTTKGRTSKGIIANARMSSGASVQRSRLASSSSRSLRAMVALPSACPLPGGCTALADGARTGEYGRCWCRGDDQVRVSWFDLLSPLFAAALALVATLLTGFFVLDHSSTVAGDSYDFWGWPEHWSTHMPTAVMLQDDTRDYGQVDDGDIDWQDPGFDPGALGGGGASLFS